MNKKYNNDYNELMIAADCALYGVIYLDRIGADTDEAYARFKACFNELKAYDVDKAWIAKSEVYAKYMTYNNSL